MPNVSRRPLAQRDLIEIWTYIADDNPDAADRLLDRFDHALTMLADHPLAGRVRAELATDLRSFSVGNYVCSIFRRPSASISYASYTDIATPIQMPSPIERSLLSPRTATPSS